MVGGCFVVFSDDIDSEFDNVVCFEFPGFRADVFCDDKFAIDEGATSRFNVFDEYLWKNVRSFEMWYMHTH